MMVIVMVMIMIMTMTMMKLTQMIRNSQVWRSKPAVFRLVIIIHVTIVYEIVLQVWRSKPAVTRDVEDRLYSRFRCWLSPLITMTITITIITMTKMTMTIMMTMTVMTLAIIDCKFVQLCTHEDPLLSSCICRRRGRTHHHHQDHNHLSSLRQSY